jgi:hypothetical protein
VKLSSSLDIETGERRYVLVLNLKEIAAVDLDRFDLLLLDDIARNAGDNGTPIADILLGLQTLALRIEQQQKRPPRPEPWRGEQWCEEDRVWH